MLRPPVAALRQCSLESPFCVNLLGCFFLTDHVVQVLCQRQHFLALSACSGVEGVPLLHRTPRAYARRVCRLCQRKKRLALVKVRNVEAFESQHNKTSIHIEFANTSASKRRWHSIAHFPERTLMGCSDPPLTFSRGHWWP